VELDFTQSVGMVRPSSRDERPATGELCLHEFRVARGDAAHGRSGVLSRSRKQSSGRKANTSVSRCAVSAKCA